MCFVGIREKQMLLLRLTTINDIFFIITIITKKIKQYSVIFSRISKIHKKFDFYSQISPLFFGGFGPRN